MTFFFQKSVFYAQIRRTIIFLKNSAPSVFDDYGSLATYRKSKKSTEWFLWKIAKTQTDRQTDLPDRSMIAWIMIF